MHSAQPWQHHACHAMASGSVWTQHEQCVYGVFANRRGSVRGLARLCSRHEVQLLAAACAHAADWEYGQP
jgi:hypothetical protein